MRKVISVFLLFLIPIIASADIKEKAKEAISREAQPEEVLTQFQRDYILLKQKQL